MSLGNKILFAFLHGLSKLPLKALYILSDGLYPLVHYVIRYRLAVVRKNLDKSFPEKSVAQRKEIENKFYHYFCDLVVEVIKFSSMSREELKKRVTFENLDMMHDLLKRHDFIICFLSHYCNWEWMVSTGLNLHSGANMSQIYHPLKNKAFDTWFLDNRSRFGAVNLPMKHTLRRLVQLRQEMHSGESAFTGYLIGCIADQLPKRENVHHTVTFLNQQTGVFTGSEKIGKMFDAAFVYSRISRPKRGYYHCKFELMADENIKDIPDCEMTDEYMRRFEDDVRQAPEFWLWTHDRWKR